MCSIGFKSEFGGGPIKDFVYKKLVLTKPSFSNIRFDVVAFAVNNEVVY